MSYVYTLYVPTKDRAGKALDNTHERLEILSGLLTREFGGVTITPSQGWFKSTDGRIVSEQINQLSVFVDSVVKGDSYFHQLAVNLAEGLNQESVLYTFTKIDGVIFAKGE